MSNRANRIVAISDGRIVDVKSDAPPTATTLSPVGTASRKIVHRTHHTTPLIEARNAARRFEVGNIIVEAVRSTDFTIYAGQRIALMGASGSGKSTLLNMLAGLEQPSAGSIRWPGLNASLPLRPQQIGFVFQSPSLIPVLTVLENVRLPLEIADIDPGAALAPEEALARLSLSDLRDKLPDQLSGGQMQRVELARALVTRPKVLFADEPTGQLDQATGKAVMQTLLAALDGSDTALVVATHDHSIADFMDELWRMDAGQLTFAEFARAVA